MKMKQSKSNNRSSAKFVAPISCSETVKKSANCLDDDDFGVLEFGADRCPAFVGIQSDSDVRAEEFVRFQVASFVRFARCSAGLKQEALACRVGISQGRLSQIENAYGDIPFGTLVAIASACDTRIELSVDPSPCDGGEKTSFRLQI